MFVYDVAQDEVERLSVNGGGLQADGSSMSGAISCDGRFVAFESSATNLVASDTNAKIDVLLDDGAAAPDAGNCQAETPTGLEAVNVTACAVTLSWNDSSNETGYELQRSADSGTQWEQIATPPANDTSFVDKALSPATTYQYRIRSSNSVGVSLWSSIAEVATGAPAPCDTDGDGLDDADERYLGTGPKRADTDGDGLQDAWEAPPFKVNGDSIEGSGFRLPGFPDVARDDVFGPYGSGPSYCSHTDGDRRVANGESCLNPPPDPLHKDVFLELDWQDCTENDSCPHSADPMHHSPDLNGLKLAVEALSGLDAGNPDGSKGINLHVLIDEPLEHTPNCDRDVSELRSLHFGSTVQRQSPAVMAAKELAVRYVWSGHSSAGDGPGACPDPSAQQFIGNGLGLFGLPDYDWSPFGDANIGGRDILITLGPVWSCPTWVDARQFLGEAVGADCDRDDGDTGGMFASGIYPARGVDENGQEVELPWPVARMLGVPETLGVEQLWSRTVVHLLGHSLGLASDMEVLNLPDQPAEDLDGDSIPDPRRPQPYNVSDWGALVYAPQGGGVPITEAYPRYTFLSTQDHDGDGVPEGEDNCPGIQNPDQLNSDFYSDGFGDACDGDADGDGLLNLTVLEENAVYAIPWDARGRDPYPFDTDNDGTDNVVDADDDGDKIPDNLDNCPLVRNRHQADLDHNGLGDMCDVVDVKGGSDGEVRDPDAIAKRRGVRWIPAL